MQHFGVARMTVRQAIDALVAEGLLERAPARGTFVSQERPPGHPPDVVHRGRRGHAAGRPPPRPSQSGLGQAGPGVAKALGHHARRRGHPLAASAPAGRRTRCATRTSTSTRSCCPASCRPGCPTASTPCSPRAGCDRRRPRTSSPPTSRTRWTPTCSTSTIGRTGAPPLAARAGRRRGDRGVALGVRRLAVHLVGPADPQPLSRPGRGPSASSPSRPNGATVPARLLAHPLRRRTADVGLDVERVLGLLRVAGQAHRPAPDALEERVLHVLRDQPGDVHLRPRATARPTSRGWRTRPPGRRPPRGSPGDGPGDRRARGPGRPAAACRPHSRFCPGAGPRAALLGRRRPQGLLGWRWGAGRVRLACAGCTTSPSPSPPASGPARGWTWAGWCPARARRSTPRRRWR